MTNEFQEFQGKIFNEDICGWCFDTGFNASSKGEIVECFGGDYGCPPLNEGAKTARQHKHSSVSDKLYQSARRLRRMDILIDRNELQVAQFLTHFTTEEPCSLRSIAGMLGLDRDDTGSARQVKKTIENLRSKWLLPIGSRRYKPSGYWMITELDDYKAWVRSVTSQSITFLNTIHKNAKHNFPHFGEQLELDFWTDMEDAA